MNKYIREEFVIVNEQMKQLEVKSEVLEKQNRIFLKLEILILLVS